MAWARTGFRSQLAGAALLAASVGGGVGSGVGGGVGDAQAADDAGGGRSVFAPSPLPSVRSPVEASPLLDFNVSGGEGDVYPRIDGVISFEI